MSDAGTSGIYLRAPYLNFEVGSRLSDFDFEDTSVSATIAGIPTIQFSEKFKLIFGGALSGGKGVSRLREHYDTIGFPPPTEAWYLNIGNLYGGMIIGDESGVFGLLKCGFFGESWMDLSQSKTASFRSAVSRYSVLSTSGMTALGKLNLNFSDTFTLLLGAAISDAGGYIMYASDEGGGERYPSDALVQFTSAPTPNGVHRYGKWDRATLFGGFQVRFDPVTLSFQSIFQRKDETEDWNMAFLGGLRFAFTDNHSVSIEGRYSDVGSSSGYSGFLSYLGFFSDIISLSAGFGIGKASFPNINVTLGGGRIQIQGEEGIEEAIEVPLVESPILSSIEAFVSLRIHLLELGLYHFAIDSENSRSSKSTNDTYLFLSLDFARLL